MKRIGFLYDRAFTPEALLSAFHSAARHKHGKRACFNFELSKYTIAPVTRGVNFVGYRTWASKRFIRKHSLFKFYRAMRRDRLESVVSILGHARKTHSLKNLIAAIKEKNHGLYCKLPKAYRQPANG